MSIPLRCGTTLRDKEMADVSGVKCQFLLGTVQLCYVYCKNCSYHKFKRCQFLLGTVQHADLYKCRYALPYLCQFLLGTVQHIVLKWIAKIPEFVSVNSS